MAFAPPRPTPAPATPLRLWLEGHRRRFIFILPELIYILVALLILLSFIAFARNMTRKPVLGGNKARREGA